jgi:DNA primase
LTLGSGRRILEPLSGQGNFHIIQMVQTANDIVDVVGEHVALKRGGKDFAGLCPFHREKTPSFTVSPEKQIYKCFGCGAGGDVIKFVQNILKVEFWEAIEFLANRAGIPMPERGKSGPATTGGISKVDIFKTNRWASEFYSSILWKTDDGAQAREYLLGRGLKEEICRHFQVGFAPETGHTLLDAAGKKGITPALLEAAGLVTNKYDSYRDLFRGRILFPIFNPTGSIVAFGGRIMGDQQPKYLNTPETAVFHKQRNLFGLYMAREAIQEKKQVVVVEGYTDCMAPFQAGVQNVVATLGTALTEQHVQILRRYADEVVLIFDSDQAGHKAADRALNIFLASGVDVKLASVTSGKDPCDLVISEGGEAFQAIIDGAIASLEYKWKQLRERYHLSTSDGEKRAAIEDLLRTVATCDPYGRIDIIQRGMLLSRLASMLSVPVEQLNGLLQRYRRQRPAFSASEPEVDENRYCMPILETPIQAALKEVLAVLVCEPGHIAAVSETLAPKDFEPEVFGMIAERLWRCFDHLGEFTLAELLGMVEESDLADIITQLYKEGTSKGNFDQTLEGAMSCIRDSQQEQETTQIAANMNGSLSEDESDRQLQDLAARLQGSVRRVPGALVE